MADGKLWWIETEERVSRRYMMFAENADVARAEFEAGNIVKPLFDEAIDMEILSVEVA